MSDITKSDEKPKLIFSLELNKEEFQMKDVAGELHNYSVNEMTGLERDAYLTAFNSKMRMSPDGRSTMTDFKNIQALLLSKTIRDEDTNKLVEIKVIETWPARTQKALFDIAQKLSGLDAKAEETAKND